MIDRIRSNWFYILLPFLLLAAWQVSTSPLASEQPLMLERVFLIDFAIVLPALYFVFLRTRHALKPSLIRAFALAGAGTAFAAFLMPKGEGQVLPLLAWLRYVMLPFLILLEGAVLIAVAKASFAAEPDEAALIEKGIPPLVVKAMIAEARFWKAVWRFMTGR